MSKFSLRFVFAVILGVIAGCGSDSSSSNTNAAPVKTLWAFMTDSTGSVGMVNKVVTDDKTSYETEAIAALKNIGAHSAAQGSIYLLCEAGTNQRRVYSWDGKILSQIGSDFADATDNWTCYLIDGKNRLVVGGKVMDLTTGLVSDFTADNVYKANTLWASPQVGNRYHYALYQDGSVMKLDTDNDTTAVGTTLPTSTSCLKFINDRLFTTSGNDLVELDPDSFVKIRDVLVNQGSMFFGPHPEKSGWLLVLVKSDGTLLEVNPDTGSSTKLTVLGAGYRMFATKCEMQDTHPRLKAVLTVMEVMSHWHQDFTIQFQEADGQSVTLNIQKDSNLPDTGDLVFKGNGTQSITLTGQFTFQDLILTATGGGFNDTPFTLLVKDQNGVVIKTYAITVRGI